MIPNNLKAETIELPKTKDYGIVIITGNKLRHQKFALKIQHHFPNLVKKWYQLEYSPISSETSKNKDIDQSKLIKVKAIFNQKFKPYYKTFGLYNMVLKIISEVSDKINERCYNDEKDASDEKIFGFDMERLKKSQVIEPAKIDVSNINSQEVIQELKKISPYFILTLGGPLYKAALLDCARGIAINQHAGHSPYYKGTRTTEWAIYHRDLKKISNTVHITSGGADDGKIIRRSNPCVFPSDSIPMVIDRVIALGTELVIEVIEDIIKTTKVTVFEQPKYRGNTYLAKDMDFKINKRSIADFKNGWLPKALEANRTY